MVAKTSRLFLIHWNREEAKGLAKALARPGWVIEVEAEDGTRAVERILADPPAVVVIYLARLPSHGRESARHLRERSSIRIVFVDGEAEKVRAIREQVPDAEFVHSSDLKSTLDKSE